MSRESVEKLSGWYGSKCPHHQFPGEMRGSVQLNVSRTLLAHRKLQKNKKYDPVQGQVCS